jgi:hypothetical protein
MAFFQQRTTATSATNSFSAITESALIKTATQVVGAVKAAPTGQTFVSKSTTSGVPDFGGHVKLAPSIGTTHCIVIDATNVNPKIPGTTLVRLFDHYGTGAMTTAAGTYADPPIYGKAFNPTTLTGVNDYELMKKMMAQVSYNLITMKMKVLMPTNSTNPVCLPDEIIKNRYILGGEKITKSVALLDIDDAYAQRGDIVNLPVPEELQLLDSGLAWFIPITNGSLTYLYFNISDTHVAGQFK